jgi:hypothetical protein
MVEQIGTIVDEWIEDILKPCAEEKKPISILK